MIDPNKWHELSERLLEPFESAAVKWKPQKISKDSCLVVAYISARHVYDRLDEVVGGLNWQTKFRELEQGVECTLSICVGGDWISKADVGSFSEQPDEGDQLKSAYSDAVKRAAVQWGIGRYLYRLPPSWVQYDANKRQPAEYPSLPIWALPKPINADQHRDLKAWIIKTEQADEVLNKICTRFEIDSLSYLPARHYLAVDKWVREIVARKVKAVAEDAKK